MGLCQSRNGLKVKPLINPGGSPVRMIDSNLVLISNVHIETENAIGQGDPMCHVKARTLGLQRSTLMRLSDRFIVTSLKLFLMTLYTPLGPPVLTLWPLITNMAWCAQQLFVEGETHS